MEILGGLAERLNFIREEAISGGQLAARVLLVLDDYSLALGLLVTN